jgi:hypothetical protein
MFYPPTIRKEKSEPHSNLILTKEGFKSIFLFNSAISGIADIGTTDPPPSCPFDLFVIKFLILLNTSTC